MNTTNLKTELGRIRGAIMSGSFDRDTALDALDKAEKELGAVPAKDEKPGLFASVQKPVVPTPASLPHPAI